MNPVDTPKNTMIEDVTSPNNEDNKRAAVTPSLNGWMRAGISFAFGATARKGFVTLADQAVASITNFLTGVIIGRTCTKEEFGLYMLGFTIVIFATSIQTSLISTPYMVYSPRLKGGDHKQYTGSTLIHQLGFATLTIVVLAIAGTLIFLEGSYGLSRVVWVLAAVIAFIMFRDYLRQLCFAGLQMKTALFLDCSVAVVQIGGLLLLAYFGILSATLAYWVAGFACALTAIGWFISMRKKFMPTLNQAVRDLVRNWVLAKWTFAASVAIIVGAELYPWILAGFHSTAATGVFSACKGLILITNPFLMGVTNFLGPKTAHAFARGGLGELRRVVLSSMLAIVAIMGLFGLVVLFLGGWLVALLYGAKYAGYGHIVSILVIGRVITSAALATNCGLLAVERPDAVFKSHLICVLVTVLLGIPLVWFYSVLGAAVAMVGSTTIGAAFRFWSFWRVRESRQCPA